MVNVYNKAFVHSTNIFILYVTLIFHVFVIVYSMLLFLFPIYCFGTHSWTVDTKKKTISFHSVSVCVEHLFVVNSKSVSLSMCCFCVSLFQCKKKRSASLTKYKTYARLQNKMNKQIRNRWKPMQSEKYAICAHMQISNHIQCLHIDWMDFTSWILFEYRFWFFLQTHDHSFSG